MNANRRQFLAAAAAAGVVAPNLMFHPTPANAAAASPNERPGTFRLEGAMTERILQDAPGYSALGISLAGSSKRCSRECTF